MGKFREHSLIEKRQLRNARQKRKRQQKAVERKSREQERIFRQYVVGVKSTIDQQKITTQEYKRKWQGKCLENLKLRELLVRNRTTTVRY